MTMNDMELDRLLGRLDVPPPGGNLAARIALAARHRDIRPGAAPGWRDLLAGLLAPRPAFALAMCLMLGLLLGNLLGGNAELPVDRPASTAQLAPDSFLYPEVELL